MNELIQQIDAFLERHRMEPTCFGLKCAKDGHLYFDIKSGRKLRRKTRGKIEDFMRGYRNGKRAK